MLRAKRIVFATGILFSLFSIIAGQSIQDLTADQLHLYNDNKITISVEVRSEPTITRQVYRSTPATVPDSVNHYWSAILGRDSILVEEAFFRLTGSDALADSVAVKMNARKTSRSLGYTLILSGVVLASMKETVVNYYTVTNEEGQEEQGSSKVNIYPYTNYGIAMSVVGLYTLLKFNEKDQACVFSALVALQQAETYNAELLTGISNELLKQSSNGNTNE